MNLHVAIASTTSKPGEVEKNLEQIIAFARRARDEGAQLLLTPEMSASGYGNYAEVLATAEVAGQGQIYLALAQAAQETDVVICAGFVEQNGKRLHLSHYVIYPDGKFIVQRKHRLTYSEQPLQPEYPQLSPLSDDGTGVPARTNFQTFEVGGVKCAVVICADAGIEKIRSQLASAGVRVFLLPTGAGGQRENCVDNEELNTQRGREKYARLVQNVFYPGQRAIVDSLQLKQAMVAVNLGAWDGRNHFHVGHGMIINSFGEIVGFFPGQPNLDRQEPRYASAVVEVEEEGVIASMRR